jgi:hypothetical protein
MNDELEKGLVRKGSRVGAVRTASGYWLDDQGGRSSSPGRGDNFSLFHVVQTASGVHRASYSMGTGVLYPGIKRQGREADH